MSSVEQKLAAARRLILELQARDQQTYALAMKVLGELEEDVRELRREVLKRNVEIYTEPEFARLMRVSTYTIARERRAGRLQPIEMGDSIFRYSSFHVEHAHELFRRITLVKPRKRGGRSHG